MKVIIDGHMIGQGEGGNERYISEISKSLDRIKSVDLRVLIDSSRADDYLDSYFYPVKGLGGNIKRYSSLLSRESDRFKADILHTSYFVPFFISEKIKKTTIVHDASPLFHPEYLSLRNRFLFNNFLPRTFSKADAIFVPSNFVKNELEKKYSENILNKVHVIHEGVDVSVFNLLKKKNDKKILQKLGLSGDFFIAFDSGSSRKNINVVLESFSQFRKEYPNVQLGLISYEEGIKSSINDGVKVISGISDNDLSTLYRHAKSLLQISSYEGFGLPILESFSCGCPVIASDIPVHKEVGSSLAEYVDVKNSELYSTMKRMMVNDLRDKNEIISRADHAKTFSWDTTAEETMSVFKQLISGI